MMNEDESDKVETPEVEAPVEPEVKKTAQDYYASFIGKQAKQNSPFGNSKPVTAKDIGQSTGKISKNR